MDSGPRARRARIVAALGLLIAGCAGATTLPDEQSFGLQGFTFRAPSGLAWSVASEVRTPSLLAFVKRSMVSAPSDPAQARTVAATAAVTVADVPHASVADLLEQVARERAFPPWGRRPLEFKTTIVPLGEFVGLRYEILQETGLDAFPRSTFLLEIKGLLCSHPERPALILDLAYSQRYLKGTPPEPIEAEGMAFLASVAFVRPPKPIVVTIPVGPGPQIIAAGPDAVWVSLMDADAVLRIDPRFTQPAATVRVGARPAGVLLAEGSVWVANTSDGTVSRIDPATNLVVATIPTGKHPLMLAAAAGSIWVANSEEPSVARIDPVTNSVIASVPIDGAPSGLAAGGGGLWVSNFSRNTVVRIDPATNRITGQPFEVAEAPGFVTCGEGAVWVSSQKSPFVTRIDLRPPHETTRLPVLDIATGLHLAEGTVWICHFLKNALGRLDARTRRLSGAPIPVGKGPLSVAVSAHGIWVANDLDGTVSRIVP